MPTKINTPTRIPLEGFDKKTINEYVGLVNTGTSEVSIALMEGEEGWNEPGQRPLFDEYTLVLEGTLVVEHEKGSMEICAREAVMTKAGEWVRYSTPKPGGAKYVAVCIPAFTEDAAARDE